MSVTIEKIPGGLSVEGLELRNGKCGCTTVLPCCYSWSKVKRSGNSIVFTAKTTGPDTEKNFNWSYTVKKSDFIIDVSMEDCRDKKIFSGYYPPRIEEWLEKGWEIVRQVGHREDFDLWRCSACKWLYKEKNQKNAFRDLPDDWKCPVCKSVRDTFEQVG